MKTPKTSLTHGLAAAQGRVLGTRAVGGLAAVTADGETVLRVAELILDGANIELVATNVLQVGIKAQVGQYTNNVGADLDYGDVVVIDSTGDQAITTTTTPGDTRPVGIVQAPILAGEVGPIAFAGDVPFVKVTAAVNRGYYAQTSATAKQATQTATPQSGSFGIFLTDGTEPSAHLFGNSPPRGGVFPWFNVRDYGAVGDGVVDDRAAINLAIADLIASGGGVLYFPHGTYKVTAALTTLSVPCLVTGDGATTTASGPGSLINLTSTTASLFTVTANGCAFRQLAMAETGGTATAGAAITTTGGILAEFESLVIIDFFTGIDIENSNAWTMRACYVQGARKYGLRIRNTASPDAGDWAISDCNFATVHSPDAAIRIESSGGGKIVNCKVNGGSGTGFNHGIDLAVGSSVNSSILLISNCSFEGVRGDGIHGTTSAGTSKWGIILVSNCQFSIATGKAISLGATTASDFYLIVVSDCEMSGGATSAMAFTKCDNVIVSGIVLAGFTSYYTATTCTNFRDYTGGIAEGVSITGIPASGDVPIASGPTTAAWGPGSGLGPAFAVPAIVLGAAAAAGAAATVIRSDATIVAFDAAAPTTSAVGDAAATGAAAVAARRDHGHGREAFGSPVAVAAANADGVATTVSRSDHVHQGVTAGAHAHVAEETHLSDGATTTYTLDEAYEPGSVIAWNRTAIARLLVTEVLPDKATVSAAGASGDQILFDYAATVA